MTQDAAMTDEERTQAELYLVDLTKLHTWNKRKQGEILELMSKLKDPTPFYADLEILIAHSDMLMAHIEDYWRLLGRRVDDLPGGRGSLH